MTSPGAPRTDSPGGTAEERGEGGFQGQKTTAQTFRTNPDGTKTFDSPEETGKKLDSHQGKVEGFRGTCGIVACVNIFRLLGVRMTEKDLVAFASSTSRGDGRMLCTTGLPAEFNGGTGPEERRKILDAFGLSSSVEHCSAESIARRVEEGRGVIICVDADILHYGEHLMRSANHAVTVTATRRDAKGNLLGFYLCDSNDRPSNYYPVYTIEQSLTGKPMNVTNIILR